MFLLTSYRLFTPVTDYQKFPGQEWKFAVISGQDALNWGYNKSLAPYRVLIMQQIIQKKFLGGTRTGEALLNTGTAYLVNHNPIKGKEPFWSDDSDGTGRNMLGTILMKRRQELGGTGTVPRPASYFTSLAQWRSHSSSPV